MGEPRNIVRCWRDIFQLQVQTSTARSAASLTESLVLVHGCRKPKSAGINLSVPAAAATSLVHCKIKPIAAR